VLKARPELLVGAQPGIEGVLEAHSASLHARAIHALNKLPDPL
jgi:hypothetical protein